MLQIWNHVGPVETVLKPPPPEHYSCVNEASLDKKYFYLNGKETKKENSRA